MFIFLLFFLCVPQAQLPSVQVNQLTYEVLVSNKYTDHVEVFQKLFTKVHTSKFLEFGLGYGTKYFLDHCDEVTSVEVILPEQDPTWFFEMTMLLKEYSNWRPILVLGGNALFVANALALKQQFDKVQHDPSYLFELKNICDDVFAEDHYDIAFVDPGFHMRGALVNELFQRVPIIVAHDTNASSDVYGWTSIRVPPNYEKIQFFKGMGVTFWIRNDRKDAILALKE